MNWPRPLISDDPFCYPRTNLPQLQPLGPRYPETMAARYPLTSLARGAAPSVLRVERRLLSTAARATWPLSAAVSAHSESRRQSRTATTTTSLATLSPRHFFSTEKPQPQTESKIWSFKQVSKLIADPTHKLAIIDVREPSELQETGKIPGAVNIPVKTSPDSFHISEEEFEDRFGYPRPGKDAELVIYCRSGVRGRAAAGLARDAGWTKVGEYPGSWLDWFEKGGQAER